MSLTINTNKSAMVALQNLNQTSDKLGVTPQDASITTTSRRALDADFKSLLSQISQVIRNASFDGADLLDNSLPGGLRFLADADATTYVTLANQDLSLGGTIITLASTSSITSTTLASNALNQLQASIGNVSLALARMGAQVRQIENHNKFVGKLSDSIEAGIGNLVDADLAKESARLQALQVQQQLGAQALSIANQSPNIILSLFRGGG